MGCARNDVDSEELAARMEAGGFRLVDDPAEAETVVVNTCGFIEQAKKDSVDTLLAAAGPKGDGGAAAARPGGAGDAARGVASGNGKGQIFVKGEVVRTVPEDKIVETLIEEAMRIADEQGMEAVEGAKAEVRVTQ